MTTPTVVESEGRPVTVTLLDANHCPGAVMFLFQIGDRRMLHVGDFRWDRESMLRQRSLREFHSLRYRLDDLYLDTTYCAERYAGVPTQARAIAAAVLTAEREVREAAESGTNTLFLFGSYTIGKERIYLSVAERLGVKAAVDGRKFRILSALDWPSERMQLLTKDKSETCVWVVPMGHVNFKHLRDYLDEANKGKVFSKKYTRVCGFRPTGWTYNSSNDGLVSARKSGDCTVYGVPYSEHSNFAEMVDCLLCLKPKRIIPTVSVGKSEEQCDLLLRAVLQRQEEE